jgi:hypothetical protein
MCCNDLNRAQMNMRDVVWDVEMRVLTGAVLPPLRPRRTPWLVLAKYFIPSNPRVQH